MKQIFEAISIFIVFAMATYAGLPNIYTQPLILETKIEKPVISTFKTPVNKKSISKLQQVTEMRSIRI